MEISAALAAELAILTQALDQPGTDIAWTLQQVVAAAEAAVTDYRGLIVIITRDKAEYRFAVPAPSFADDIRASLTVPLPDPALASGADPIAMVILYAATKGTFVDVAADLSWLTGIALTEFVLDAHLDRFAEPMTGHSIHAVSLINQAIGVLIARGHTPEEASLELDSRAADARVDRHAAAVLVLGELPSIDPVPDSAEDA